MEFLNDTLAIVVLYKQRIEESKTFLSLYKGLIKLNSRFDVVVYDNSPEKQYFQKFFMWENFNIQYYHDTSNPGVSKAYNYGASIGELLDKKWLLLLDQDTFFDEEFLPELSIAINAHNDVSLFVPILKLSNDVFFSPSIAKHKRGYLPKILTPGIKSLYKFSPVNSGIFIKLSLFEQVNGYNERVKLDFSDFQFLEKVRKVSPDFFLIDSTAIQDFSNEEVSFKKIFYRFNQYIEDAINSDKPNFSDKLGFFYAVSRHTLSLTYKQKNISFLSLYLRRFILR